MKTIFSAIIFLVPALAASAQTGNYSAMRFDAEGHHYYQVKGCRPGSEVAFYSHRTGGRLLATLVADANGTATAEMEGKQTAALVLNRSMGKVPVKGSGSVAYYGGALFGLNRFAVSADEHNVMLNWYGNAAENGLVFTIMKSTDGVRFTQLATQEFRQSGQETMYRYTDETPGSLAFYKLVVSSKEGKIYTSSVQSAGSAAALRVYPSPAVNTVSIAVGASEQGSRYRVLDMNGKTVLTGVCTSGKTDISVQDLAPGNYIVVAGDERNKRTGRFVKQ